MKKLKKEKRRKYNLILKVDGSYEKMLAGDLSDFGIIRKVNTLERLDIAPILDNGQNLNFQYYDEEELHISGERRLFYEVKPFDEIIKVVKDIKRIDITKLDVNINI